MFTLEFLKGLPGRYIIDHIIISKSIYDNVAKWKHIFKVIPITGLLWFILFNSVGLILLIVLLIPLLALFSCIGTFYNSLGLKIKHWFIKE